MKYIDNLLDWGDSLFAQDTWESITQATMLYFFAYDLLGPKPKELGKGKSLEPTTFSAIKNNKEKQITEAQASLESLNKSLQSANNRVSHYQSLIAQGLSAHEQDSEKSTKKSLDAYEAARVLNDLAVPAHLIPTIFGFSDGGFQPGNSVQAAASAADGYATIDSQRSSLAATSAQYDRRREDWALQLQIAQDEVAQINQQIAASKINVDIATAELTAHQKSKD